MQVTPQAAVFFLARQNQLPSRVLEVHGQAMKIRRELETLHDRSRLSGEIGEQRAVRWFPTLPGRTWSKAGTDFNATRDRCRRCQFVPQHSTLLLKGNRSEHVFLCEVQCRDRQGLRQARIA